MFTSIKKFYIKYIVKYSFVWFVILLYSGVFALIAGSEYTKPEPSYSEGQTVILTYQKTTGTIIERMGCTHDHGCMYNIRSHDSGFVLEKVREYEIEIIEEQL